MANSLLTGISGIRGHQKMLEVVGNNLANLNTTAFKSSRVIFSDLWYEVQQGASSSQFGSSSSGFKGSINSVQIGTGSRVSQVDVNFAPGNLESTGNELDLAMEGGGFFVAASAERTYFTRAGAFSLDESGYLSDPSTGYLLKRLGTLGEVETDLPAFQTPGDDRVYIPKGVSIPGQVSSELSVKGNLISTATGRVAQELTTSSPFLEGGIPATALTRLSDLDNNKVDYTGVSDKILFAGRKSDGTNPAISEMSVTSTTTLGDLITQLNLAFPDATLSLNSLGQIIATSNTTGPSLLSISFADGPSNVGRSDFEDNEMILTNKGKNEDSFSQPVEVFDESGAGHSINLTFTKQADSTWSIRASLSPIDGTMLDDSVEGLSFQPNGSFAQVTGTGLGDANIIVQFRGMPSSQTISLNFGQPLSFDGLTSLGQATSLELSPDGYPPGEMSDVKIDTDGKVFGLASNGVQIPLAQLAIASFRNPDGLVAVGSNYYSASLASGAPDYGTALTGSRGAVRAGQLESSNVDLALEFTRLIIAQRGFSANARTITVTDEILQELTSLIR